jgi:hypothetical protein
MCEGIACRTDDYIDPRLVLFSRLSKKDAASGNRLRDLLGADEPTLLVYLVPTTY